MENKNYFEESGDIIVHSSREYLCLYWVTLPDGTKKHRRFYARSYQEARRKLAACSNTYHRKFNRSEENGKQ